MYLDLDPVLRIKSKKGNPGLPSTASRVIPVGERIKIEEKLIKVRR